MVQSGLYRVSDKVIHFKNNAREFLNGLTSNQMDEPFNAFLNIHGRVIATCFQKDISEEEHLIVVHEDCVDDLMTHLDKYMRLSGVVGDVRDDHVYFCFGSTGDSIQGDVIPVLSDVQVILSEQKLDNLLSDDDFINLRHVHNMPIQKIDYNDEMILNINPDRFVSFNKGCFLGQEPVAKVHHRSKPRWRLQVAYAKDAEGQAKADMTSVIWDEQKGDHRGFAFLPNS